MFEDILGPAVPKKKATKQIERSAPQRSVNNTATWNNGCHNCKNSSQILSNYSNKLLCVERKRHVDPQFYCNKWTNTN